MNKLLKKKSEFKNHIINKSEFINSMTEYHGFLFEYIDLLKATDISKLEITTNGIVFTSKEDKIQIFCNKPDKRTAPFEIMNFDTYETEDASMLYELVKDGDTIFDIGANIGWYSLSLSKRFPNSKIYSFEPIPSTYSNLIENIELNRFANIIPNNFGLSDKNDEIQFYLSPHTTVSGSANNITDDKEAILVICSIKKLDDFIIEKNVKVDFIKCDVEGAELFTFRGGYETLKTQKPIVFSEMLRKWSAKYDYHPNDIIDLFSSINYKCFYIYNSKNLKEINSVTEETEATNFIFLHIDNHKEIIKKYS